MAFKVYPLPEPGDYYEYYDKYVSLMRDADISQALADQVEVARGLFGRIAEENGAYRYAEGKWSVKGVLQHINDSERVMAYRALSFSREPGIVLPGFDQDPWDVQARAERRTLASMVEEFEAIRRTTIQLFESFAPEHWSTSGNASGYFMKTCALPYVIAGHVAHHANILNERYSAVIV